MAENKEFYLVIKGEKIIVSEEVYRAYKSSDRAERKRKQRRVPKRTNSANARSIAIRGITPKAIIPKRGRLSIKRWNTSANTAERPLLMRLTAKIRFPAWI